MRAQGDALAHVLEEGVARERLASQLLREGRELPRELLALLLGGVGSVRSSAMRFEGTPVRPAALGSSSSVKPLAARRSSAMTLASGSISSMQ